MSASPSLFQCFEGIYEGGKIEAMKRRRMLIEADPKRQEAKTKRRLAKLKKKVEAMQQKKVQSASSKSKEASNESDVKDEPDDSLTESRKRKRDVDDGDEEEVASIKEEEEEAAQLESALDMLQDDAGVTHKTREEAEMDRQKLLAGTGLQWDEDEEAADVKHDESDAKLSMEERDAEILRRSGLVLVSDDEATVVGGNRILPWRKGYRSSVNVVKKEEEGNDASDEKPQLLIKPRVNIKFKTEFPGLIELDPNGRAIDKGDDDFTPSSKWIGRKGGFEYKLGERGLGYYRTGKKVVVPSNVAFY
jgi:hypothetical protein